MANFEWFRPGYELFNDKFKWNIQVPFLKTAIRGVTRVHSSFSRSQNDTDSQWKLYVCDAINKIVIEISHYNSAGVDLKMDKPVLGKMSIIDGKGRKVFQQMTLNTLSWISFKLSKEEILKSECQQADGSLTFYSKIISHMKIEPVSSANHSVHPIDCSSGLITHLEGLFDKMPFSDVNFNIGGREFPAHKNILTARSKVFEAMFQHPTKEKITNQIVIEDIEPEVFHQLLRFIYTGRLSSTTMETMATGLLIAADKYLMDELKIKCENYLFVHMSQVNCVELLLHGDVLNPAEYLKKAAKFFLRFPLEVMATDKWIKTKQENSVLLFDILEFVYRHQ